MKRGSDRWIAHMKDRPTPFELDSHANRRWVPHGEPEHKGWRCQQCAGASAQVAVSYGRDSAAYWQEAQLKWQEVVDAIQNEVDRRMLIHFRDMHPPTCASECLREPQFPPKPEPPYERT